MSYRILSLDLAAKTLRAPAGPPNYLSWSQQPRPFRSYADNKRWMKMKAIVWAPILLLCLPLEMRLAILYAFSVIGARS
jgi:hypothetical protein